MLLSLVPNHELKCLIISYPARKCWSILNHWNIVQRSNVGNFPLIGPLNIQSLHTLYDQADKTTVSLCTFMAHFKQILQGPVTCKIHYLMMMKIFINYLWDHVLPMVRCVYIRMNLLQTERFCSFKASFFFQ